MADLAVIGKPNQKDTTVVAKMTGRLDYAGDNFPGKKLFAHALLSNIAHGKIKSIDTSAATALPGVKAVTTYQDCPALSQNITFWGQEVAVVAAVDEETANRATELVKVTYDTLPAVIDPDDAMKAGATSADVWPEGNVRTSEVVRGDINAGFQQADVTVQDTVSCERWQHQEIEERTALAYWTGDHLYLWTSSQNPYAQRADVAGALKLPMNKVHLTTHGSGAGHGNKHSCPYGTIAAVLAKKSGMPVLYQLSRREHILTSDRQHWGRADIKIGVKKDGTITALDGSFYGDDGGNGSMWAGGLSYMLAASWKCPNARFRHYDIATNTTPTGAFRCVADPPSDLFQNQILDMVAAKLGMDPLQFKLKNLVTPDMVHQDMKMPYGSLALKELFQKAADGIGWASKWHAPGAKTLPDGRLHGIGIAGGSDSHGCNHVFWGIAPSGAIVIVTNDGKALVNAGQSHCAGSIVAMVHIVAEALGMAYDDVQLGEWGDTDTCADGGMEGGSTRTITEGAAFYMAAQDALQQVFAQAAPAMKTTADKLGVKAGNIYDTTNPANTKAWGEVMAALPTIVGRGYTWAPALRRQVLSWPVGTPALSQGSEATAVEIAVDPETGEIEILNMVNAIDAGRAVYLRGTEKEINGGMEIQIGEALYYYQILERATGATVNPSFLNHKQPTSLDIPQDKLVPAIYESDDAAGPYGAHGIGEPCVNAYACFNAAFYNATGQWIKESPITPWKVLAALGKA